MSSNINWLAREKEEIYTNDYLQAKFYLQAKVKLVLEKQLLQVTYIIPFFNNWNDRHSDGNFDAE